METLGRACGRVAEPPRGIRSRGRSLRVSSASGAAVRGLLSGGEDSVAGEGAAERRHGRQRESESRERSLDPWRGVNGGYCETSHKKHRVE